MGPSPTYHPPEGEECETSVEHGLPLWAEPAVGYCSRRPRPSPMWGSRFVGAREVGPWVGEQKPLGKSPLRGNPSPESTYLPTTCMKRWRVPITLSAALKLLLTTCSTCWKRKQRGVSMMISTRRAWLTCCVFPSSVGRSNRSLQGILQRSTFAGC